MENSPRLSVIIVNYNVEYFLAQCLFSVRKAAQFASIETIVVDNNSSDGSVEMVKRQFPEVQIIANTDNKGFSKANNQAMRLSTADYVLLLNPDTLVEEDTFQKCIDFMDAHPNAGGLGVKMVDGKGQFLPESKRGLPTPLVAFYKIFGLSALFPKSKTFGQYHLGHLDNNHIHKIDILSGAFMMMRKSALDKVGLLDEEFFMYGEDIDLSWRIRLGGYDNYYFPATKIIHYKGESTKKSSVNYVIVFYNAMIIFAKKHFSKSNAHFFEALIKMAIYLRAGIAIIRRFVEKSVLPVLDFVVIVSTLFLTSHWYSHFSGVKYPSDLLGWILPMYGLLFSIAIYFSNGYSKLPYIHRIITGVFWGGITSLLFYGLLSEEYRFSRAVVVFGSLFSAVNLVIARSLVQFLGINSIIFKTKPSIRVAIVGKEGGISRVKKLLNQTTLSPEMILEVYPSYSFQNNSDHFIANLGQLPDAISIFSINQIIYCGEDMDSGMIINEMMLQENPQIELKIAPPESTFIIGSQSIHTSGDILSIKSANSLEIKEGSKLKRLFDLIFGLLILGISPLLVLFQKNKWQFIQNVFSVIFGWKTWVGFAPVESQKLAIDKSKPSILFLGMAYSPSDYSEGFFENLNLEYCKKYYFWNDIPIILSNWKNLDN